MNTIQQRKGTRVIETLDGKQIVLHPSQVVHAMCDGLDKYGNMPDTFQIEMKSFGGTRFVRDLPSRVFRDLKSVDIPQVCIGCAATCAIQELWQPFDEQSILTTTRRAFALCIEQYELCELETELNAFRCGEWSRLADYFEAALPRPQFELFPLGNDDWANHLPAYRAYARQLEEAGY